MLFKETNNSQILLEITKRGQIGQPEESSANGQI